MENKHDFTSQIAGDFRIHDGSVLIQLTRLVYTTGKNSSLCGPEPAIETAAAWTWFAATTW